MNVDLSVNARKLLAQPTIGVELTAFVEWMAAELYTPFVTERHLRRLSYVIPRLPDAAPGAVYSAAQLAAVFARERTPPSRVLVFASTRRIYIKFLRASGRLRAEAPGPYAALRVDYARFLLEVRGLSGSSRHHHGMIVDDFLARGLRGRRSLRLLTRADIERYVLLRSRQESRHSLQHSVAYLRAFLRFAHDAGYVDARLDAIDTPRTYRHELPPRAIPWEQVLTLLRSVDRHSKSGWRDLCILHLIAYYGLRPSEVVALRLDSIDWDASVLNVCQRKTRSMLVLPLAAPTLRLIKSYLRHDRTQRAGVAPELLLRARCPFIPLERTAIGDIFAQRAREAGITGLGKHVYRLRHTLAMRMLSRGVGMKAIGDVLGHRSFYGTAAYLRLDVAMLRGVALDVPVCARRAGGPHA
jgi:integrase